MSTTVDLTIFELAPGGMDGGGFGGGADAHPASTAIATMSAAVENGEALRFRRKAFLAMFLHRKIELGG